MKRFIVIICAILCLFGCSKQESISDQQIVDYSKLLYKVSAPNGNYAYVLGTIHLNEGKIEKLDEITQKAYDDSEALALEIDLDPSQGQANASLLNIHPVKEELSADELAELKIIVEAYPSIPQTFDTYNLGTINLLATQDIVAEAGYSTQYAIDSFLYYKAKNDKKTFYEFESYSEQLNMIIELGISCKELTIATLADKDAAVEQNKKMGKLYQNGDIEGITTLLTQQTTADTFTQQAEIMQKKMIDERNDRMSEKLKTMINDKVIVFAAVGAGHVLGDTGILKQLEAEGYTITPMHP